LTVRWLLASLILPGVACASSGGGRGQPVDLAPARKAVETARKAGAAEKAPENLRQAEAHLKKAEKQPSAADAHDDALKAEWLARIATVEAQHAAGAAAARPPAEREARASASDVAERLRKSEEQRIRQEKRIALLMRDLEVAETEIIRTKARLKGIETKAEASSAIAEARILVGRLEPKTRADARTSAQQAIDRAEELLLEENYGAALFFATKAQQIAKAVP
jgi:hypothetical protein